MGTVAPRIRVVLLAAASLVIASVPFLTDDRYLLKILTFVGLNAIVVAGLALLLGFAGQISMGHAAFFGLGAYTSAYLTTAHEVPWLLAVAAGTLLAATGGLLLALPSLRLKGHYLAMATLGFNEIMSVLFVEMRGITGGNDGLSGIPFPSIGSLVIDSPAAIYILVWAVAALAFVGAANLVRTRPGRAMRALHGSELGALASGVNTVGLKVQVFAVSAALAGLAGALYAHSVGFISPSQFSLEFSILLVAMVVVGGTGSLTGPFIAAVALTLLQYVHALIPGLSKDAAALIQDWEVDISGLVMILTVIFVPGGLAAFLKRRRSGAGVEGEIA